MKKSLLTLAIASLLFTACNQDQSTEAGAESTPEQEITLPSPDQFDQTVAYVLSIGEGTISAIDLNNNKIRWTLKISEGTEERTAESAMGIASTPDGKWVFTGDVVANEAVIIDTDKQEIVKRIPLTHGVHAIDINPYGHWVWVAGRLADYPWLTATTVSDAEKQEKVTTLSPGLGGAAHFAWTPDAKEVWVASISTNTAWVWKFEIQMNTHSGDLMQHDLTKQSVLYLNNGSAITNGFEWEGENESSHHRKGVLTVRIPEQNMTSFELEIKDIGVPSRKFEWNQAT